MSKKKKKTASTVAKKRTSKDDPEQSQRFVEAAKELNADEGGGNFEKAIDMIKQKSKDQ